MTDTPQTMRFIKGCLTLSGVVDIYKAGRAAQPFDVELDSVNMDLTTSIGFSNALSYAANLEPGSGHTSAPVCSTFVFMILILIQLSLLR